MDWFTYHEEIFDATRDALIDHTVEDLGKRFAFWKAFLALMKTWAHVPLKSLDRFEEKSRFYCSQFVAHACDSVGLDLKEQHATEDMTPKDLATSPKLKNRGSIYKSRESGQPYDATGPRPSGFRRREDAA